MRGLCSSDPRSRRRTQQIVVLAKLGARRQLAELLQFARGAADKVLHADLASGFGGKKRRGECDVANVSAGEFELAGEEAEINVVGERGAGWNEALPDALAQVSIRERKFDNVVDTAGGQ